MSYNPRYALMCFNSDSNVSILFSNSAIFALSAYCCRSIS